MGHNDRNRYKNQKQNQKKERVGKLGWFMSKTYTTTFLPREGEPVERETITNNKLSTPKGLYNRDWPDWQVSRLRCSVNYTEDKVTTETDVPYATSKN